MVNVSLRNLAPASIVKREASHGLLGSSLISFKSGSHSSCITALFRRASKFDKDDLLERRGEHSDVGAGWCSEDFRGEDNLLGRKVYEEVPIICGVQDR